MHEFWRAISRRTTDHRSLSKRRHFFINALRSHLKHRQVSGNLLLPAGELLDNASKEAEFTHHFPQLLLCFGR